MYLLSSLYLYFFVLQIIKLFSDILGAFMESRHRTLEDLCKRRQQRNKVKDEEKPFHNHLEEKPTKYKLHPLKFVLMLIFVATLVTILSSPTTIFRRDKLADAITRLIYGNTDPRYISHLDIEFEDISKVIDNIPNHVHEIGLLNFNKNENNLWKQQIPYANHTVLKLDYADKNVTWELLYPEWIDEEQDNEVPKCPTLPKLDVPERKLDLIAVKLPCLNVANWSRDVSRLHLQLATAGLVTSKGDYNVHVMFVTKCFPMPNLFSCKEIVTRKGDVWLYKPDLDVMKEKLTLPVGSCELALPLGVKDNSYSMRSRREAYATILHSADVYVCGAIAAAQSIRMSGSTKDLVILVDETFNDYHKSGLEAAGWTIRTIRRIRNPKAEKDAYNEWNYSKFRLWQLTDYDKIIFIDADLIILRNIDFLFKMPEISATGNNGTLFNSGVMVIEPSNCTFNLLMDHINEIESYNGGDQGYLNEIFTWWHRIPKHMNYLKHFWVGDEEEVKQKKIRLFGAEPPVLYVLHYLGYKPWMCYRDYDCNWNVDILQEFASDIAHKSWWKVYDEMPKRLHEFCLLGSKQKAQLEWDRRQAEKGNYTDRHWRITVKDPRMNKCIDRLCNWKGMLRHWGEKNWTDDKYFHPTPPALTLSSSLSGFSS